MATNSAATGYANQRKLDRCQNGNLVTAYADTTTNGVIKYSADGGATWASAATDIAGFTNGSIFVDLDDYLHVVWQQSGTGGSRTDGYIYYMRGTPNAGRTSWTWSAVQNIMNELGSTNSFAGFYPDLVAFRDGTGWQVAVVASWARSTPANNNYVRYVRIAVSSGGGFTLSRDNAPSFSGEATAGYIGGDYSNSTQTLPSIDFNHTGDGKTVAGGTPHLYAAWSAGTTGSGKGIRFKKATYSAGTWTWGTEREIDPNLYVDAGQYRWVNCLFDGTRVIIGGSMYSGSAVYMRTWDRDAADTTTTQQVNINGTNDTRGQNVAEDGSLSYDQQGNVYLIGRYYGAIAGDSTYRIGCRKWNRVSGVVEPTVVADAFANTGGAQYVTAKRGFSSGLIEWLYMAGNNSPYAVKYDRLILGTPNVSGGYG